MLNVSDLRRASILAVALLGVISGCTVGPNYIRPRMDLPAQFGEADSAMLATTQSSSQPALSAADLHVAAWWKNFRDPQLDSLVARAFANNLDLKMADARIRQARAQYGIAVAGEFPVVNTDGSMSRSHSSGTNSSRSNNSSGTNNSFRAGFDSSWEIDVFGRIRRGVEAASDEVDVAVEDRRNVLVSLASEVAANYITYRGTARQITIAKDNIVSQRESLAVTRRQFDAGLKTATELDVRRAEALVFSSEAQVPNLEASLHKSAHALSILLGKEPNALNAELNDPKAIPAAIIPVVPIGLPSDLLRRRPDIRRSERQLAAATARIGVATADLFPRFSLTGSFGQQSGSLKSIADSASGFWSIGPSVNWPILDFGKIRANIRLQNAFQEQSMLSYEQTVLDALGDVENALISYSREQLRRSQLNSSAESNKKAVILARQRYDAGLTDFLSVLDAQRSLFSAQDQLVQSERIVSTNLVALYKALGGGWEIAEPTTTVKKSDKK